MYLGIDLGTSSVKAILLDENHRVVGQKSHPLSVSHPKPLWSEQDPDLWWQATSNAVLSLRQTFKKSFSGIKAIGLSGQQHGATLLGINHEVLRPAMLWNDGRAMRECQTLTEKLPEYPNIIGSKLMAGFTAPKVYWVAEHEPAIFKQISKVLLPKDYLRLKLTGDFATDLSDASGTAWIDVNKRKWSTDLLNACELTEEQMPKLFEGTEVTGTVSAHVAKEWGVSPSTVVAGGGGDNPAGAMSVNVIKQGSAFLSLGTSGVYFVSSNVFQSNPAGGIHTFCHCIPNYWHHMSVHLSAASCLTWLSATLKAAPEELLMEAEEMSSDSSPVIFLPYLSGERTPHADPHAKGTFFGMTHTTTRADMTRAVLEGVAFAFADGQDAMLKAGIEIDDVSVVGGGAKNLYWGKILAAALGRPLIYRANREVGSALGAARLAWLASNPRDAVTAFATPEIETVVECDPELSARYAKKREIFKLLYVRLADVFAMQF
jgi:xylulokinase